MEHQNFERELKYLFREDCELSFNEIVHFFIEHNYNLIESRLKKKNEIYYDDKNLFFINKGDVIRSSTHINEDGKYFHFMYKKNVSDPVKPYVSKYEYGSGKFNTIQEFLSEIGISAELKPVLFAEMVRETAIFEKNNRRLLVSYDNVKYFNDINDINVYEKMLEIEDWTSPNTIANADDKFDSHLCEINRIILGDDGLPLKLTMHSKPLRGIELLNA